MATWAELSRESLQAARSLAREGFWRSSINRSYYAAYCAVTGELVKRCVSVVRGWNNPAHEQLPKGIIAIYEQELKQMRQAVKAGRVRFTVHSVEELAAEGYSEIDAYNCILTGEIVEDQYDLRYRQVKYIVFGDARNGDEIGLVARFDAVPGIVVITAFQLEVSDYD
ncbi:MAG TPA: DUF4258 domain-containing protein [Blastocatellia bacterium]|nr:DUF4258 domain-containing protein [Blastocatellia bacterium]HMV84500.1 DUF4258 domain-containing protein [Blastocatellia bacterium]HMY73374.1 DUF4258 domain-containing protein [Blastocatellia bacterium]HMZ18139.1 DUF4258 domain-containing protein [Blastocatellia bacterium]HNG30198.1 DUF4258 domain-containing protein [Blastocatellia bacterium]